MKNKSKLFPYGYVSQQIKVIVLEQENQYLNLLIHYQEEEVITKCVVSFQ